MDVFHHQSEFDQVTHSPSNGPDPTASTSGLNDGAQSQPPLNHSGAFTTNEAAEQDSVGRTPEKDAALRGKASSLGLTAEEKKERQKQQNRRAAERSRNKKREEVTALEMTVNNIQEENHRLRSRLSSLLTSKSDTSMPPVEGEANDNDGPTLNVDYAELAQLQAELSALKTSLLQREIDWNRLRSTSVEGTEDDFASAQQTLLSRITSLQSVQLEARALHMAISELHHEYEALSRQHDAMVRELEARRMLRDASGEDSQPVASMRANGVERTLLDLRGLLDGVIRTWEQSSTIPAQPNGSLRRRDAGHEGRG